MALYTKKNIVEAFSFNEVKEYAKENSTFPHWSFKFRNISFTQENEDIYIADNTLFTKLDILVINNISNFEIINREEFNKQYKIL